MTDSRSSSRARMARRAGESRGSGRPNRSRANGDGARSEVVAAASCDVRGNNSARPITDWIAGWVDSLRVIEGKAPATCERYRRAIEAFVADRAIGEPSAISLAAVEQHVKLLFLSGRSTSSRATAIVAIRLFCRYLLRHQAIATNPAADVRPPKVYRKTRKVFSRSEIRQLIGDMATLPRNVDELVDAVMFAVVYSAALRPSEPVKLRTDEHLEWLPEQKIFLVRLEGAKHRHEDALQPIDPRTSRLLGAYLAARADLATGPFLFPQKNGRPITVRDVHRRFAALCDRRGIPAKGRVLAPKTLRASICTHLLESRRVNAKTVQLFMRHASIETTMAHYAYSDESLVVRMVAKHHPLDQKERGQIPALGVVRALLGGLADGAAN